MSCTVQADFETFAEGLVSEQPDGGYAVEVYNSTTGELYDVAVFKEYDPGGKIVAAWGQRADAVKHTQANALRDWVYQSEHAYVMPQMDFFQKFQLWWARSGTGMRRNIQKHARIRRNIETIGPGHQSIIGGRTKGGRNFQQR